MPPRRRPPPLVRAAALAAVLAGCGDGEEARPPDATTPPPDAAFDPFAGHYDDPGDFVHGADCVPGSLATLATPGLYPPLAVRTAFDAAGLHTFTAAFLGEREVPHVLTADDLVIRVTEVGTGPDGPSYHLTAFDACAAEPDGTLRGSLATCYELGGEPSCDETAFEVAPLHRIAGEAEADHLSLIGEFRGAPAWPTAIRTTNVRVDGTLAAVSRYGDGLRLVSIANPAAPVDVGYYPLPDADLNDVKLVRGSSGALAAVLAAYPVQVVDLSTPSAPQLAADLGRGAHTVFVEGTRAYLASGFDGEIPVFDVADPYHPQLLGTWVSPKPSVWYHDLFVEDGVAYLSDSAGAGLDVVDLTDPANPVLLGQEDTRGQRYWHSAGIAHLPGREVALDGDEGEGSGLRLLEGDPAAPDYLATITEWHLRDAVSIHNFEVAGSRIYLAHYLDGIRVVDVATPEAPAMIGYFNTWIEGTETALGTGTQGLQIDPARRRIYVADCYRGLVILAGDATVFP